MSQGVIPFAGEALTPYQKEETRKTRGSKNLDTLYRILAMPLNWFYQISGNYVIAMVLYAMLDLIEKYTLKK